MKRTSWSSRSHRVAATLAITALVGVQGHVAAQEPTDSLRAELVRLAVLVDSLREEVAQLTAAGRATQAQDALAELRAAAAAAATVGGPPAPTGEDQQFVGRQRSLQALNPEISVNADLLGHLNQDRIREDNFLPREFEISLISNLDPFSRAKVFIAHHEGGAEITPFGDSESEEHAEGGLGVEEGYVEWVGLAGGVSLKLGRFFQQFGQMNRWHAHALPFQSRSLPHLAFIGEESLAQSGVSVHWLAPVGGASGTYEATLEVTRSENEHLFGENGGLSVLGHLNGFWNLSESTDFDLGLSWIHGAMSDETSAGDRDLYGAEMALTWRPPGQSRYRGFTLRGGVMALQGLVSGVAQLDPSPLLDERVTGWWTSTEVRLNQSWLVGGRIDRVENPLDASETAWLLSPTATWWQSEYVRLRVEYDLLGRSSLSSNEGRFYFQVTFAMGPHKHETY